MISNRFELLMWKTTLDLQSNALDQLSYEINLTYKFYKKLVLISINIKPIKVIISYFFFRKYEKKLHTYIYSVFIFY